MTALGVVEIHRAGKPTPRLVFDQVGDDEHSGGVGGWETLPRPGRPDMTAWNGTPAVTWSLPVSLDRFDSGLSVERDVETLKSWGLPDDDGEPPRLVVSAPTGRGAGSARWVIQDITWGEQVRNAAGERIRQDLTLALLEYVPGQVLKGPAAKARGGKGRHKWVPISAKDRRCRVCKKPRGDKQHTNKG